MLKIHLFRSAKKKTVSAHSAARMFCVVKKKKSFMMVTVVIFTYNKILDRLVCIIVNRWFWELRLLRVWFAPFSQNKNCLCHLCPRYCTSNYDLEYHSRLLRYHKPGCCLKYMYIINYLDIVLYSCK